MKKFFMCFLIVGVLFFTTACGKDNSGSDKKDKAQVQTLTCTKSETDEDGNSSESNAVIKYNDGDKKVISFEETTTAQVDSAYIDFTLNLTNVIAEAFSKVDGISMKATKENDNTIKTVTSIDYSKLNVESMKEALGDLYSEEDAIFNASEATIDDLKNNALKDYTCK